MMRVNRLQSAIILIASFLLTAALAYAEFYFMQTPAYPRSVGKLLFTAIMMGAVFGTFAWASLTVPDELSPSPNWRVQVGRGILWWLALFGFAAGGRLLLHMVLSVGDMCWIAVITMIFTFMGWGLATMRVQRAENLGVKRYYM